MFLFFDVDVSVEVNHWCLLSVQVMIDGKGILDRVVLSAGWSGLKSRRRWLIFFRSTLS